MFLKLWPLRPAPSILIVDKHRPRSEEPSIRQCHQGSWLDRRTHEVSRYWSTLPYKMETTENPTELRFGQISRANSPGILARLNLQFSPTENTTHNLIGSTWPCTSLYNPRRGEPSIPDWRRVFELVNKGTFLAKWYGLIPSELDDPTRYRAPLRTQRFPVLPSFILHQIETTTHSH